MAEPGTLAHFYTHRDDYLDRTQAVEQIGGNRATLYRYLADGLPSYKVLGKQYVLESQLHEMRRSKIRRNDAHTHVEKVDLPSW